MSSNVRPMETLLEVRKLFQEVCWQDSPLDRHFRKTAVERFRKGMDVVVSFPAVYGDAWAEIIRTSDDLGPAGFAATGHWIADGDEGYGVHDVDANGICHCQTLYGKQADFGCRWYTLTLNKIRLAHEKGCSLIFVTKIDGSIGESQRRDSSFLASQGMRVRVVAIDEFAVEMTAKRYGLADAAREIFDLNASDKIDFLGSSDKSFQLADVAIVSFPGVHGHGWNRLTRDSLKEGSTIATSCVFLPTETSPGYGQHPLNSASGDGFFIHRDGCYCDQLYPYPKYRIRPAWGCRWYEMWTLGTVCSRTPVISFGLE